MICILCKSKFLFSRLKSLFVAHSNEDVLEVENTLDLLEILKEKNVEAVFFDSELFTDTSCYRCLSPSTRFIVIGRSGFENLVDDAIRSGACDFILFPTEESGVLRCL